MNHDPTCCACRPDPDLAARLATTQALLRELWDYTVGLEGGVSPWFVLRSYAAWPRADLTLGRRVRAALGLREPETGGDVQKKEGT